MCRSIDLMLMSMRRPKEDDTNHVVSQTNKSPWRGGLVQSVMRMSRAQLSLQLAPTQRFARSQWQTSAGHSRVYLVYRWLIFIFLASTAISSFACQELTYPEDHVGPRVELNYFKWFIYLTNWGFMLCVLQAALALAVIHCSWSSRQLSISCESGSERSEECWGGEARGRSVDTPLVCRAYWLAYTVAADLAFVISLVYWTRVYDPKLHRLNALNILVHGCNSVVMLTETLVISLPVRPYHALYTILFGTAYSCFSAVYYISGGTDRLGDTAIYRPLDWSRPATALTFVGVCAACMCMSHAVNVLVAHARAGLAARCRSKLMPRLDKLPTPVAE